MKAHPRFEELLNELLDLHEAKGDDYANPEDILANLRECETLGFPGWVGVVVRICDKVSRIRTLTSKSLNGESRAVLDESIIDTLKDLSSYGLLAIILFEEWERKQSLGWATNEEEGEVED